MQFELFEIINSGNRLVKSQLTWIIYKIYAHRQIFPHKRTLRTRLFFFKMNFSQGLTHLHESNFLFMAIIWVLFTNQVRLFSLFQLSTFSITYIRYVLSSSRVRNCIFYKDHWYEVQNCSCYSASWRNALFH